MDPVEYFGWLYGKGFFFNHPYWGAAIIGSFFALIAFLVSASLWLMGAERYRERHTPTITKSITPTPATKPSDHAPPVHEKVEPLPSVKPVPSVNPTPHKATRSIVVKKDIPVERTEPIPVKPKKTLASVLIEKYPDLPSEIERPHELFVSAWIKRIDSIRRDIRPDRPKFNLERLIQGIGRAPSNGPTVKEFVDRAVAEATFTLRCLASEGYVQITETPARGRWLAIDFPNLEVEFVPERLNEFIEGV